MIARAAIVGVIAVTVLGGLAFAGPARVPEDLSDRTHYADDPSHPGLVGPWGRGHDPCPA